MTNLPLKNLHRKTSSMAINFAAHPTTPDSDPDDTMLHDINTTPLVDVMLVLLIIFLITIPVVNASVAVRLPQEANLLRQHQPKTIVLSVDASGATYWFDAKLPSRAALAERLAQLNHGGEAPEVHIRGDARANYEAVARVVLACQQAGITRIGFITEPPARL
jgi:biopolymer transport protein ExbD